MAPLRLSQWSCYLRNGQKLKRLGKCILTAAEHCHVFALVEKGITHSTIADALSLVLSKPLIFGVVRPSTGCKDKAIGIVGFVAGFDHELIFIPDTYNLVLYEIYTQTFRLCKCPIQSALRLRWVVQSRSSSPPYLTLQAHRCLFR